MERLTHSTSPRPDDRGDCGELPVKLRRAIEGLSDEQLEAPYREGGWTVRQVVHHVADSHMNTYIRSKLALTERVPTVKPYDEARWAEIEDGRGAPLDLSLRLLDALHARWVILLRSLGNKDFIREYQHPEAGLVTLEKTVAIYAWHGAHHTAHITSLRERRGWR